MHPCFVCLMRDKMVKNTCSHLLTSAFLWTHKQRKLLHGDVSCCVPYLSPRITTCIMCECNNGQVLVVQMTDSSKFGRQQLVMMNYAWIEIYLMDSVILLSNNWALATVHQLLAQGYHIINNETFICIENRKNVERKFEGLYSIFKIHIIQNNNNNNHRMMTFDLVPNYYTL